MSKFNTEYFKKYICEVVPTLNQYWANSDPEIVERFKSPKNWKRWCKKYITIAEMVEHDYYCSFFQADSMKLVTDKENDDSGCFYDMCHVFDVTDFDDEGAIFTVREFTMNDADMVDISIFTNKEDDRLIAVFYHED